MRCSIVAVVMSCVTLTAATAAADASKTLQRAKQLVDKSDYLSATIELQKVLDGESGDDVASKNLAQFLMARSLFELEYYAAAAAFLDRTLQQDVSAFRAAAYNYVIKIVEKSSPIAVMGLLQTAKGTNLSSTDLTPDTKEALTYQIGVHAIRNTQFDEGRTLLQQVPRRSKYASEAQLRIAESYYRQFKQAEGLAATLEAAKDSDVAWRAVRDLIFYARHAATNDEASDPVAVKRALTTLAEDRSPAGGLAELELSYAAAVESKRLAPLVADSNTFAALVITSRCLEGPAADGLARLAALATTAKSTIQGLLADDENEQTFARVTKFLDDAPTTADGTFIAMILGTEYVKEYIEHARALKRQLERLADEDRAWQTTRIAADVLQELTLQRTLAEAEAGKLFRDTLDRAARGLDALLRDEKRAQLDGAKPVTIGEAKESDLIVPARLCGALPGAKAAAVAAPAAAGGGKKGCGGCATDRDSSVLLLLALVPLLARRRDTRRCLARGR